MSYAGRGWFILICLAALLLGPLAARRAPARPPADHPEKKPMAVTITMLYNNIPTDDRCAYAWGLACLVEGCGKTLLFDTGGDGSTLLKNMATLGKDPARVRAVAISHDHYDHADGLWAFLGRAPGVELFLPKSFPEHFFRRAQDLGARTVAVSGPGELFPGVYSTGEMGMWIKEQGLILKTPAGLVVITGCAHPGILRMVRRARETVPGDIYLVMGGFHLMSTPQRKVAEIIEGFKALGVRKVGPSHCTGDEAIQMFQQAWGQDFMNLGCGAVVRVE